MSEKLKPCPFCGGVDCIQSSEDGYPIVPACLYETTNFEDIRKKWDTRPIEDVLRCHLANARVALKMELEAKNSNTERADKAEAEVKRLTSANQQVLDEAISVIYFADRSDYLKALWEIVRVIGGEEAVSLLGSDERAAFEKYTIVGKGEVTK